MDHNDRIALLLQAMEVENLDTIVCFSSAAHHVDFGDTVALLSGIKPLSASFATIQKNGETALYITPSWDLERAESYATVDKVEASDDLNQTFAQVFKGSNTRPNKIGFADLGKMPHRMAKEFIEALGGEPKDVSDLVFSAAARKTDQELKNALGATEIAERTYNYMFDVAEVGMPECYLAAELKNYSRSLGADDNFMMFHSEGHPLAVQPSSERKLEKGDLILAEITPSFQGQFAQICRTACLGEPTDIQFEKYDLLVRAMMNGISAAKPGAPMKDICLGVDEVLCDNGYEEFCAPPYMNRRGHGLGMTSVRPGDVSLKNETILEDGMFFVVHPNQYIPEAGYFLCGEPIVIRDPNPEVLTEDRAVLGSIPI